MVEFSNVHNHATTLDNPDEMVTVAFLNFMRKRHEIHDFLGFYHKLAERAIRPNTSETDTELYNEYMGQSIFFLENYLCRFSDLFEVYLDDLIYSVCLEKEDFLSENVLSSARNRLTKFGFDASTELDVLYEASNQFGKKDRDDIADHFFEKLGFDLRNASPLWPRVQLCGWIRNLIVHKASQMDEKFVFLTKDLGCPFEVNVGADLVMPEAWIMDLVRDVDRCIYSIDSHISKKARIEKRSRSGHFWLTRSYWANPLKQQDYEGTDA